jgi:glycosyltransferase involved in cell wall biosynthesis
VSDLSVLIPARNERWLARTVADVCEHAKGDTDVIVVLDGAWPEPGYELQQHPKVQVIYLPEPIGQRAATNLAARVSTARWVMKLDAHCSVADGFDVALMEAALELGPNVTQVPAQKNLHVYNQVCEGCGAVYDQAPARTSCHCGGTAFRQDVVWQPRHRPTSTSWVFDRDLHFQYSSNKHQTGDCPEVMSMLGACLFVDRQHFLDLGGFDEAHGSWGQYGQEWACKEWLSGGRVVCNRRTTYAHFFRVGGIGFPYEIKAADQEKARQYAREYWRGNKWPQQRYPLRWLVEKFWPVSGWTDEQREALPDSLPLRSSNAGVAAPKSGPSVLAKSTTKSIIYYSDCRPESRILEACRRTIERSGLPIVAVTLKPIHWSVAHNIVLPLERSALTMFRQILAGLEAVDSDVVFFAEHDVAYARPYWDFMPPRDDCYYYNLNCWKVDADTGRAVTYITKQTSQLCANRELLIEHYRKRVALVEQHGFSRRMGFEPGSHRRPERVDDVPSDVWWSAVPNVDIRHSVNLTQSRWSPEQFRDPRNCQGWQEADAVPGWGVTRGRFAALLMEAVSANEAVA